MSNSHLDNRRGWFQNPLSRKEQGQRVERNKAMKTISRNLLLLAMAGAVGFSTAHSAEVQQSKIPYQLARVILETKRVGVFKLSPKLTSKLDEKGLPPLTMYVDSRAGRIPVEVKNGRIIQFPFTDALSKENPFVVANRPKGSMRFESEMEFDFAGDYSHPHQCEYRDLMGVSIFAANVYRIAAKKPALSAEKLHGWAPTLLLTETNGMKAVIQINGKDGITIHKLCNQWVELVLDPETWQENPTVLLAFKPADVRVQIASAQPRISRPYLRVRKFLETKRVGVMDLNPSLSVVKDPVEWPPLEIYIDARSGRIPLQLTADGAFKSFPITDELSEENPRIVVNRPPGSGLMMSLEVSFSFKNTPTHEFKCRYRDLLGVVVYVKNMELAASGGSGEQSVSEMQGLRPLPMKFQGEMKIEIRSQRKPRVFEAKDGETHKFELDKDLWHENPEVIIHCSQEGGGAIGVF